MKILFFSHGKRANGGAERCLLDLVKGLKQARESWEIYVVFPAKDELWERPDPTCRDMLSFASRGGSCVRKNVTGGNACFSI